MAFLYMTCFVAMVLAFAVAAVGLSVAEAGRSDDVDRE